MIRCNGGHSSFISHVPPKAVDFSGIVREKENIHVVLFLHLIKFYSMTLISKKFKGDFGGDKMGIRYTYYFHGSDTIPIDRKPLHILLRRRFEFKQSTPTVIANACKYFNLKF